MTPRWSRGPEVLWRRSGDRVVILRPGSSEVELLEGVAALVWELLGDGPTEEALVDLLTEAYREDARIVRADLMPFLRDLERSGAAVAAP